MRRCGRIVSVAAIVAVAVNTDGRSEVLGIAIQPSEAEVFWNEFLRSLADRGLRGVKLIIADEHKGLKAAADKVLGATIQRCRVHFMRNALACVGKKDSPIVTAALRTAFDQDTLAAAKEHWAKLIEAFQPRHPKLAELMLRAEDDVLAYKTFPQAHWRQIHSTNPLERSEQRDQASHQCRRNFPQRASHQTSRRCADAGAERRMGRHTPLHDAGNRRRHLRGSTPWTRRKSPPCKPAQHPAGEQFTPRPGALPVAVGWVVMSERELNRVEVLSQVAQRRMTVRSAADVLDLALARFIGS